MTAAPVSDPTKGVQVTLTTENLGLDLSLVQQTITILRKAIPILQSLYASAKYFYDSASPVIYDIFNALVPSAAKEFLKTHRATIITCVAIAAMCYFNPVTTLIFGALGFKFSHLLNPEYSKICVMAGLAGVCLSPIFFSGYLIVATGAFAMPATVINMGEKAYERFLKPPITPGA